MKVVAYPKEGIAYVVSFYTALQARGVRVIAGSWSGRWIAENVHRGDLVHLHWPSFLYVSQGRFIDLYRGFARFVVLLLVIRLKGARIFWTAHNLFPHERAAPPWIDILGRNIVVALSEAVFVHGEEARRMVSDRFPRSSGKCVVIPHGHWTGAYGENPGTQEARRVLGIPDDAFVFLSFGGNKPYRNLVLLVNTFRRIGRSTELLIIAGKFPDPEYLRSVRQAADGDPRIRIYPEFVPDDCVVHYLSAANVMCVPYEDILTSGVAMLAMSYGLPVVSIDRGFLRDCITPDTGILFRSDDHEGLACAMSGARTIPWCRSKIIDHARRFTFEEAAALFEAALRRV